MENRDVFVARGTWHMAGRYKYKYPYQMTYPYKPFYYYRLLRIEKKEM